MNVKIKESLGAMFIGSPQARFYAGLLTTVNLKEDKCGTACTDCVRNVWVDPEFINTLTLRQAQGVLVHEIKHKLMVHHTRKMGRDARLWNIAGDVMINHTSHAEGFYVDTDNWVWDEALFALGSTEAVYDALVKRKKDDKPMPGEGGASGLGDGQDTRQEPAQGSAPTRPLTPQEQAQVASDILRAAKSLNNRDRGNLPGDLQIMLEALEQSKVDWRSQLQQLATVVSRNDYSWRHPSRRMMAHRIYAPSMRDHSVGPLVIAVDTSGSMLGEPLRQAASEVFAIVRQIRPAKVHIVYVDTQVAHVDTLEPHEYDTLEVKPHGGGGTSFRAPFEWQRENAPEASAIVYLTDGHGDFPDSANVPTFWCIVDSDVEPPFGTVVRVDT